MMRFPRRTWYFTSTFLTKYESTGGAGPRNHRCMMIGNNASGVNHCEFPTYSCHNCPKNDEIDKRMIRNLLPSCPSVTGKFSQRWPAKLLDRCWATHSQANAKFELQTHTKHELRSFVIIFIYKNIKIFFSFSMYNKIMFSIPLIIN